MQSAGALLQLLQLFESSLSRPPLTYLLLGVEVDYALGGARVTGAGCIYAGDAEWGAGIDRPGTTASVGVRDALCYVGAWAW